MEHTAPLISTEKSAGLGSPGFNMFVAVSVINVHPYGLQSVSEVTVNGPIG